MKKHTTAVLFAGALLMGAQTLSAAEPAGGPVRITSECPSQFGPSGGFADASSPQVKLVDDVAQAKRIWRSEETGIGCYDLRR
jgi:hypothetical protein